MIRRFGVLLAFVAATATANAQPFLVYVTNERSGDLTIIDGESDAVLGTFPIGKRPRGIQTSRDGKRVFIALSGSPRMAPGVDVERAPADKTADGIGVFETTARRLVERWHLGSDPEQLAIDRDGKLAFI